MRESSQPPILFQSGRFAAAINNDADVALAKVAAANLAREAARREGLALQSQAAGMGTGLMQYGISSLGQSADFGNSALNAGSAGLRSTRAMWGDLGNSAVGLSSSATSGYNSVFEQNKARAQAGLGNALAGIVGQAAGMAGGIALGNYLSPKT